MKSNKKNEKDIMIKEREMDMIVSQIFECDKNEDILKLFIKSLGKNKEFRVYTESDRFAVFKAVSISYTESNFVELHLIACEL